MNQDSKPNFRDLYKQKGKNLTSEADKSKLSVKEKLSAGINQLTTAKKLSPLLVEKILHLGYVENKSSKDLERIKDLSFKSDKHEIQMLVLHFGLMLQRATASAISSPTVLHEQFCKNYPNITHFLIKDLEETLKLFQGQGLLYQFSPTILFEPLEQSQDINKIFALLDASNDSLTINNIKQTYPEWSNTKIIAIIDLMSENGLVIRDGETLWFPQLAD